MLQYQAHYRYFGHLDVSTSLSDVWNIAKQELSPTGESVLDRLAQDNEFDGLCQSVAWTAQALIEFQDLQSLPLPQEGRFVNLNYCFYEALSALREGVLAGLNGLFHASFAVLRSALELHVSHYWWRDRLMWAENYYPFYRWLTGDAGETPFREVLRTMYQNLELPENACGERDVNNIYRLLCSYAHKPILEESLISIKGSNLPITENLLLNYWLDALDKLQRCLVHLSIVTNPACLFPVTIYRKFGFNPPVGLFFDVSNSVPLQKALGDRQYKMFRDFYSEDERVRSALSYFYSFPDLTDDEILATYEDAHIEDGAEYEDTHIKDDSNKPAESRIISRYILKKAQHRAMHIAFAYQPTHLGI